MKTNNKKLKIKNFTVEDKRMNFILIITIVFFIGIILRILYLNIFMANFYNMKLSSNTTKYVYGESSPRGLILDRNGKVLVGNKAIKSIYYKKEKNVTLEKEIEMAYKVSKILKLDYDSVLDRNLREFYILIHNDETSAYLYYLMNKGYSYDEKEIKTNNVTDKEYAYFTENSKDLNGFNTKLEWERTYPYKDTLSVILGSVSSKKSGIPKDEVNYYLNKGYTLTDRVGISGIEKEYEDILKGEKAVYKLGENNKLVLVKKGKKGTDIKLSIDIDLQRKIDKMLASELINAKKEANTDYFNRSYVVIQNPNTGEIYSMSGKKLVYKNGKYKAYDNSEGTFLSTVTPGSVVKGASIMVGYTTGAIKIGDHMVDSCIGLYNLPPKCSWRNLGYINDLQALAYSSNVYQYKIAMKVGGFNYAYGKKLKIKKEAFDTYRNMFYRFGLGVKTGLDYPKEEDGYKSNNRAGDLLINYAIGQYDTYTTLQLSQYISTIANGGTRYKTRFLKEVVGENKKTLYEIKPVALNTLEVNKKYLNRVKKGLRGVMTYGTGIGYMDTSLTPSGKTGTSESFIDLDNDGVIDAESISNNFVGYAPSKKPVMSIAASFPDIQNPKGGKYKSSVNQTVVAKSTKIFFSLYDKNGKKIKKN